MSYSIGFGLTTAMVSAIEMIPSAAWSAAIDADDVVRDGAWVADATGLLELTGWPKGMRVIVRKERPHPGAQLRFTDSNGLRLTAFARQYSAWDPAKAGVAASAPRPLRGPNL